MSTIYPFNKGPLFDGGSPRSLNLPTHEFGIYNAETTQRYMLGTRFITWDGRVYKYGLASATLSCQRGAGQPLRQVIMYNNVTVAPAIGDYVVTLDVATTDADGSGNILEDAMAGGYVVVFDNSNSDHGYTRAIVGNTAVATGSTDIVLDLDMPWHFLLTTDDNGEAMSSPYYGLQTGAMDYSGKVCVPVVEAVDGEFFWGQTWGPKFVEPQVNLGAGFMQTGAVFRGDGTVDNANNNSQGGVTYTDYAQVAGFVLSHSSGSQAAPFTMLTISI